MFKWEAKKKKKKPWKGPRTCLPDQEILQLVERVARASFFIYFRCQREKRFSLFFFFLIYFIFRDPAHLNLSSTGTCRQHVIQINDIRSEVRARTKLLLLRFISPRLFHRPMKDWAPAAPKRRAEPKAIEKS